MRMHLVAIFVCASFALCCVCCVWPCIAFGTELTSEPVEPVADSATSGPTASDAVATNETVATTDDVVGPSVLGSAPLAASAVTLDTVNNNVLAVPQRVWDKAVEWNRDDNGNITSDAAYFWQLLMRDSYTYHRWGRDNTTITLYGYAHDNNNKLSEVKNVADSNKRTLEEINWETSETMALLFNDFPTVKSDVAEIKSAVTSGSGSGSVSIADDQWKVLSDTVKFQNFALLVLTLLSSASIGCSLWTSFSKGWRR